MSLVGEDPDAATYAQALTERRFRRVHITADILPGMCSVGGYYRITKGLARGARLARISFDAECDSITVVACHPTFDPVPEGCLIPSQYVEISQRVWVEDEKAAETDG